MSAVTRHPRFAELVARRELRKKVARAVSRLIAILDELDGDPDVEPDLGAPEQHPGGWSHGFPDQRRWAAGVNDNREGDVQDEPHDPEEAEPSLALPERHHDQRRWAASGQNDLELTDDEG